MAFPPETAVLPADWESRIIRQIHGESGEVELIFITPVDAAYSKLAAGREKDFEWARLLFQHGLANQGELARLILGTEAMDLREKLTRNFVVALGRNPRDVAANPE